MRMQRWNIIIIFGLGISIIPKPIAADGIWTDIGKACLCTGAAVLGIGGLIGLCKWMMSESDIQRINNAHREYRDTYNKYIGVVTILERAYNVTTLTEPDCKRIVADINEPVLYDIAFDIWRTKITMDIYRSNLNTAVHALQRRCDQLHMRIAQLRDTMYADYTLEDIVHDMETIVKTIQEGLPHFVLLRDYINHHKSYFALFACEDTVRTRYYYELQVITDHAHDRHYIQQEIRRCIALRQSQEGSRYPYIQYVETLDYDMRSVDSCIRAALYAYADRLDWSSWVLDALGYIHALVVTDPMYTHELYMREREYKAYSTVNNTDIDIRSTTDAQGEEVLAQKEHIMHTKYNQQWYHRRDNMRFIR